MAKKKAKSEKGKNKKAFWIINAITMYRLLMAPFLVFLAWKGETDIFKWLVAFSFFTDAIDGPLTRHFKVTSVFGARLDSVADDATVFASTISLWFVDEQFVRDNWMFVASLFTLFLVQVAASLVAYKKVTSFHTYLAKTAAVAQGIFFFLFFFDIGPKLAAFYLAIGITAIELIEEIVLVIILPKWKANVKGLYWVWKKGGVHT
jgi:CDP-diacylglycerol--glycerol-3-phosphate 3-phosphatidyltransferase